MRKQYVKCFIKFVGLVVEIQKAYSNRGSVARAYMAVAPPNEWPITMGFDKSSLPWNKIGLRHLSIIRKGCFSRCNNKMNILIWIRGIWNSYIQK